MKIGQDSLINENKKNLSFTLNKNNNNNKEEKFNSKLLLSDGIFGSKNQEKYNFLLSNDLSNNKNNIFPLPNCKIISSLFSKDNLAKSFQSENTQSIISKNNNIEPQPNNTQYHPAPINSPVPDMANHKENQNNFSINYKIYNIKESSLFHIKIFGKYIKYFPIFPDITEFERLICYNPLIENNPNFELISPDFVHNNFVLKNNSISTEYLESLKEKYVKHLFTQRNIIEIEGIFKYLFEEIKINLSCINVQSPYDDILMNCSNLINNINQIIDDIILLNEKSNKENVFLNMNKPGIKNTEVTQIENIVNFERNNNITNNNEDNYCIFNKIKIKKNFILSDMNSKCIENNFFLYDKNNINQFETNNVNQINNNVKDNNDYDENFSGNEEDEIKKSKNIQNLKIEEKNKKETFACPFCSRIFNSHCGLGGHMSKRHPKKVK